MSKDRLQVFTEWLCREIPMGTVIGNPNWWAPRILSAVDGATREATSQPEATTEMSWKDVEYRSDTWASPDSWVDCPMGAELLAWGDIEDKAFRYRHARTHEPISYEQFMSLVNKAKAEAQPTPTEVTQATQVYAGMERERLWVEFANGYMNAKREGDYGTFADYAGDCAKMADAMLAEFDRRFRKGGE